MSNVISLDDPNDPRLQPFANLKNAAADDASSARFVVEGKWCLQRLAESPLAIESALVQQGREAAAQQIIGDAAPIYSLPRDAIRNLVGYDFHRGVLGCGIRPPLLPLAQLPARIDGPTRGLAIVGVSEKENVGGMLRSAAALGFSSILVGPGTIDPYCRRSVRVSMGSVLFQQLYDFQDPVTQLHQLAQRGFRTVVTTLATDATPLDRFQHDDRPVVLVMGSEASGVDASIEQAATDRVTLPMKLGIDSLNVAAAAAIFMYQLQYARG